MLFNNFIQNFIGFVVLFVGVNDVAGHLVENIVVTSVGSYAFESVVHIVLDGFDKFLTFFGEFAIGAEVFFLKVFGLFFLGNDFVFAFLLGGIWKDVNFGLILCVHFIKFVEFFLHLGLPIL